jgi:transcriptional regulator with XRE-family HTH domain
MKYNEQIRELLENARKNQTEIAKILGTSQSYYSEYELGKRELPIKHLIKLCRYYKVSADYVLGIKKAP